jgi:N-acetylglutamate synthase-like GNAT family acetyltransferase
MKGVAFPSKMPGRQPVYRRARQEDYDPILRVLEFANFHRIPSAEMPSFDIDRCFVAELDGAIVGVAGYTLLGDGRGKTTLMAVDPGCRRSGIGRKLQELRMREMSRLGCKSVVTNADLPETIAWYKNCFGYREIGTVAKLHEFGDRNVDQWTTLEADLPPWSEETVPNAPP